MDDNHRDVSLDFLYFKIVQSGEKETIPMNPRILNESFGKLFDGVLKKYNLKKKFAYLTTKSGVMLNNFDLRRKTQAILQEYSNEFELYYDKIM